MAQNVVPQYHKEADGVGDHVEQFLAWGGQPQYFGRSYELNHEKVGNGFAVQLAFNAGADKVVAAHQRSILHKGLTEKESPLLQYLSNKSKHGSVLFRKKVLYILLKQKIFF